MQWLKLAEPAAHSKAPLGNDKQRKHCSITSLTFRFTLSNVYI